MAAGAIVGDVAWLDRLQGELRGLLAPVFAQARSRLAAFAYIGALLAEPGDRRSCWQLAEAAEKCVQQRKGQTGLDQHQVRTWHSFHRHTVLSMCAQALLAIAAARPATPAVEPSDASSQQPAAWADAGTLPASADDQPPGEDPGLVKVSVPGSTPAPPPGHRSHGPRRPRPRPRLVTMATAPPGPRPMAPLPRPAQSRPHHMTLAGRKEDAM